MPRLKFLRREPPISRCTKASSSLARSLARWFVRSLVHSLFVPRWLVCIPDAKESRTSALLGTTEIFERYRRRSTARNSIHVKVTTCTSWLSGRVHALPSNFRKVPYTLPSSPSIDPEEGGLQDFFYQSEFFVQAGKYNSNFRVHDRQKKTYLVPIAVSPVFINLLSFFSLYWMNTGSIKITDLQYSIEVKSDQRE